MKKFDREKDLFNCQFVGVFFLFWLSLVAFESILLTIVLTAGFLWTSPVLHNWFMKKINKI